MLDCEDVIQRFPVSIWYSVTEFGFDKAENKPPKVSEVPARVQRNVQNPVKFLTPLALFRAFMYCNVGILYADHEPSGNLRPDGAVFVTRTDAAQLTEADAGAALLVRPDADIRSTPETAEDNSVPSRSENR